MEIQNIMYGIKSLSNSDPALSPDQSLMAFQPHILYHVDPNYIMLSYTSMLLLKCSPLLSLGEAVLENP